MLDTVYSGQRAMERVRRSWLRPLIDSYFRELAARQVKKITLLVYANALLSFGEFLEREGVQEIVQLPRWIQPFVNQFHAQEPSATNWRSMLTCFVRYLRQQGLIPTPEPSPPTYPHAELIAEYAEFLREHRGVTHNHIQRTQRCCEAFVTFVHNQGVAELSTLPPEMIHRFIIREGKRYTRITVSQKCSALRRFLSHLYRRGVMPRDLSPVVVSPRLFTHEQCPRFLTRSEVKAVFAVVDRLSPRGKRDFAMMLLLSVYGLRGIEVVRLRLDDINWRNQILHIRGRKAGNQTIYPLSASVGEAILSYLRDERPESEHREVFLTISPPFSPFANSGTLCHHVKAYIAKAGIRIDRPGMHAFRYSCAQRLLGKGESLKTIGDYLGHSHPQSTQRYTKIAIDQLRDVAIGDGEDVL